jgi:hypothetical protein
MSTNQRVQTLWVFLGTDERGFEAVMGVPMGTDRHGKPEGYLPLVCSTEDAVQSMRALAQVMCTTLNLRARLVRCDTLVELEQLSPLRGPVS